ncbi:MAG TPA: DUF2334 domain-containing protein [Methylophilaceae bacterium]|jgi:hypothetical protein
MVAHFVLRLDDACPAMARAPWARIEAACEHLAIRPIVGVIPDCRDPDMRFDAPDPHYWKHVRRWQEKGWTIAMHGLHHAYHEDPPGSRALIPFHRRGEFVGLTLDQQMIIIAEAWRRFEAQQVKPTVFMAPSHSFDLTTLEALRRGTDIRWITDGIAARPFSRHGFGWLPVQIAKFHDYLPFGYWTVCIHPNTMLSRDLERLINALRRLRSQIVMMDAIPPPKPHDFVDWASEKVYWSARALRDVCRAIL